MAGATHEIESHIFLFLTICEPVIQNGKVVKLVGIFQDITIKKKYEEQTLQVQKMEAIGTLAGGIAHDFNNMLSVLTGNLSYALSILPKDEELHEVLSEVLQGTKRTQSLTQQLLTFAKGGEPIKKPCDVNKLLEESAKFVTSGAKSKCEFHLDRDLWPAEVDYGQINQIVANLIINADQSMPGGGVVTIRSENITIEKDSFLKIEPGRYVKISIADQGAGIAEKHLPSIFNPYFTIKQTGSGLGLATVYSIIKRHNGHIAVISEEGKGSVFDIFLPASSKTVESAENKAQIKHRGQGRILIMDDQEPIVKMVSRMLDRMGYTPTPAANGGHAINLYREAYEAGNPFDLVILDLTVPGGMGGAETLQELLKIDPKVKAVVSSGYSNDPIMADYQAYGFCGVIPKPFTKEHLAALLDTIM